MDSEIAELNKRIKKKEGIIGEKDTIINQKDKKIKDLENEIESLKDLNNTNGLQASELEK